MRYGGLRPIGPTKRSELAYFARRPTRRTYRQLDNHLNNLALSAFVTGRSYAIE